MKPKKQRVYKDLEKLLKEVHVPATFPRKPVIPPSKLPILHFDADRFRWLFGTAEGAEFLRSQVGGWMCPSTLQGWRNLVDKEMDKCDDQTSYAR